MKINQYGGVDTPSQSAHTNTIIAVSDAIEGKTIKHVCWDYDPKSLFYEIRFILNDDTVHPTGITFDAYLMQDNDAVIYMFQEFVKSIFGEYA